MWNVFLARRFFFIVSPAFLEGRIQNSALLLRELFTFTKKTYETNNEGIKMYSKNKEFTLLNFPKHQRPSLVELQFDIAEITLSECN